MFLARLFSKQRIIELSQAPQWQWGLTSLKIIASPCCVRKKSWRMCLF